MKRIHPFLILAVGYMMIAACSKDDDSTTQPKEEDQEQLPPITQEGAYTFGCLIDGEIFLPKHYSNSIVNPPVVLFGRWAPSIRQFSVGGEYRPKKEESKIRKRVILTTKEQTVGDTIHLTNSFDSARMDYFEDNKISNIHKNFVSSIPNSDSWVYFSRFDTINRIASGTFSADLVDVDNENDTVRIRDGRFDVIF